MSLILKVTPAEVKTMAGRIKQQKGQMEADLNQLMSKVNRLHDSWDSKSGKEFQGKFQKVTHEVNDSLNALEKHVQNLQNAAQQYRQTESQNASAVKGLSTENIF